MAAAPVGEVLSVSEAEGFELRLKVYKDTSKSEKTANKRKKLSILRHFLAKMPPPFQRRQGLVALFYIRLCFSNFIGSQ